MESTNIFSRSAPTQTSHEDQKLTLMWIHIKCCSSLQSHYYFQSNNTEFNPATCCTLSNIPIITGNLSLKLIKICTQFTGQSTNINVLSNPNLTVFVLLKNMKIEVRYNSHDLLWEWNAECFLVSAFQPHCHHWVFTRMHFCRDHIGFKLSVTGTTTKWFLMRNKCLIKTTISCFGGKSYFLKYLRNPLSDGRLVDRRQKKYDPKDLGLKESPR